MTEDTVFAQGWHMLWCLCITPHKSQLQVDRRLNFMKAKPDKFQKKKNIEEYLYDCEEQRIFKWPKTLQHTQRRRLPDRITPQQKLLHTKGVTNKGDRATQGSALYRWGNPGTAADWTANDTKCPWMDPRPLTQASQGPCLLGRSEACVWDGRSWSARREGRREPTVTRAITLTNVRHWGPCISTLCLISNCHSLVSIRVFLVGEMYQSSKQLWVSSSGQDVSGANATCYSEAFTWEGLNFSVKFNNNLYLFVFIRVTRLIEDKLEERENGKKWKSRSDNNSQHSVLGIYKRKRAHTYTCRTHTSRVPSCHSSKHGF